ncbi:MAG: hypothetical protein Q9219_001922 [cf. Caloplaca sp. 3 TL-2023]
MSQSSISSGDIESQYKPPSSILVAGAGVFGLSTTLALLSSPVYAQTRIVLVDPDVPDQESGKKCDGTAYTPNPHASSIDSSRIIRPDYANPAYSRLAAEAQEAWRAGFGGADVYHESGLVVVAGKSGNQYVEAACRNVEESSSSTPDERGERASGCRRGGNASKKKRQMDIQRLANPQQIRAAAGLPPPVDHSPSPTGNPLNDEEEQREQIGMTGYINRTSGWANAEGAMRTMMQRILSHRNASRLTLKRARVKRLLFTPPPPQSAISKPTVSGVLLSLPSPSSSTTPPTLHADLTILATGAWTPSLLDLRGRLRATGQIIAYLPLTSSEAHDLRNMTVLLNLSTGNNPITRTTSNSPATPTAT